MHFSRLFFVVAVAACVYAAPEEKKAPAQTRMVDNVKEAFAPVAKQVRTLLDNSEKAADSVGKKAIEAGERLMESARSLFETAQHSDRNNLPANLKDRMAGIQNEVKADVRSVLDAAIADTAPLQANVRSILSSSRSAMEMLATRYLTPDGMDLVRTLVNMAGLTGEQKE